MFTFSRSTNQITIVFAVFVGLFFSSVSAAEAGGLRLTPAKQTVRAGSKAQGLAAGRHCSVRLPSRKLIRVNGKKRWSWKANRAGRFQVRMRCGRKVRRATIVVKARAQAPAWVNLDGKNADPESSEPTQETPQKPLEPRADMTSTQLIQIYRPHCMGSAKKSATAFCQKVINYTVSAMYDNLSSKEAPCQTWLYRNCDAEHPYGNPYDLSNGGGICSDWAYYKRPDIRKNIDRYWYKEWLNAGATDDFPQINFGQEAPNSPRDAWTTWARKAGYTVSLTPKAGALQVSVNHLAYVEKIIPPTAEQIARGTTYNFYQISEMNVNNRKGIVQTSKIYGSPRMAEDMKVWFVY